MINILQDFYIKISQKITDIESENTAQEIPRDIFDESVEEFISNTLKFIYSGDYIAFLANQNGINDLNAEYILCTSNIREDLSLLTQEIQNQLGDILKVIQLITEDLAKCVSYFLKNVVDFSSFQNSLTYRNYVFQETSESKLKELYEYCNIFLLEYFLSEDIVFYENLLKADERVEKIHNEIGCKKHNILRFKLTFLKYKWKKRQKYNREFIKKNGDPNYSQKFVFVNEDVDLSHKIKIGEEFYPTFEDWINKIELHYFNEKLDLIEQFILTKVTPSSTAEEDFNLFFTIKFYKDIEPDFNALNNLRENIKTANINKKNRLYFVNNLFSLLVTSKKHNEKEIESYFEDFKNYSNRLQSNNYFIYYKFLDYKRTQLQEKINKDLSIEEIDIELKKCEDLYKECNRRFEWTYKSFNVFYQFNVNNSQIEINNDKVYFPTAFLLPFNVTEYKILISLQLESLTGLKHKLIELKNTSYNTIIEKQIKDNEKKLIEMISLFTAVISFIMGSISGFQFVDNAYESILFMLALASALGIFVMLILFATRGFVKEWAGYVYVFLLVVLVCLTYWGIQEEEKKKPAFTKEIKHKIDSIVTKKVDSIILIKNITKKDSKKPSH